MNIDKITNRVRKLLELADHGTEHEAASAASQAAALMDEYQLSEALIRLDEPSKPAEPVVNELLEPAHETANIKRVAWKEAIADSVAMDLGIKVYYWTEERNGRNRTDVRGMGRESAIQTWRYTCSYLWNTVNELAETAFTNNGYGSPRAWKGAFRLGAAIRIATRLNESRKVKNSELVLKKAGLVGKESLALTVVEKDREEVDAAYAEYSKGWKGNTSNVGQISSQDGYEAGKAAGDSISLGSARAGLTAGQGRLT